MEDLIALVAVLGMLALAGGVVWRLDRYSHTRLQLLRGNAKLSEREQAVALLERETQAYISQQTRDEQVALEKASLRLATAEKIRLAHITQELTDDALLAERRRMAAQAAAQESLAEEFARSEHEAKLEAMPHGFSPQDVIAQYQTLIDHLTRQGVSRPSFDGFVDTITRLQ